MKQFPCLVPLILAGFAHSYSVLAADAPHAQPAAKPVQVSVASDAQDKVPTDQLRVQYQSARDVCEKLLKGVPAAEAAKLAADQASKAFREAVVRENTQTQNELADLRKKMDECVKAYLGTNADYANLQPLFEEARSRSRAWTNWARFRELQKKAEKLQAQTARSPEQDAELKKARDELAPLEECCRVMREEQAKLSGKLSNIKSQAMQTLEHKGLAHQYMGRQMEMWDNNFKNEKLRAARQAMLDTKKLYDEQLAQHLDLQQAKERMDEAFRAFSKCDPFEASGFFKDR